MQDISGVDKVKLLKELWDRQSLTPYTTHFSPALAADAVQGYIDYFCGKAIKLDLSKDHVDPWLYSRDASPGSFDAALKTAKN